MSTAPDTPDPSTSSTRSRRSRPRGWSDLTEDEREVWVSVEEEGLRVADLVDFYSWDESTMRTLLSRARRKIDR